jgi:predicted ABC-type ATPase
VLRFDGLPVVDPDAIAREESIDSLAAGRVALKRVHAYLDSKDSFGFETTFSGSWARRVMSLARAQTFRITFAYIGTSGVRINLDRIRSRVATGGHDVPETDVRRRYERSLDRAGEALAFSDSAFIYDNSGRSMVLVAARDDRGARVVGAVPQWASRLVESLLR